MSAPCELKPNEYKIAKFEKILRERKDDLNRRYGVIEIGIFGSYTKNQQNEASDLDILVEFHKGVDLFAFVNLKNHLSELLGVNVDLAMKKALKPKIGQKILNEATYV